MKLSNDSAVSFGYGYHRNTRWQHVYDSAKKNATQSYEVQYNIIRSVMWVEMLNTRDVTSLHSKVYSRHTFKHSPPPVPLHKLYIFSCYFVHFCYIQTMSSVRIWIRVPPTHGPISRKPREVVRFPDGLPPACYGPFDIFLGREQRVPFQGFPGFFFEPGFSGGVTTGGQHEPLAEVPHQRVHLWISGACSRHLAPGFS